ncbi:AAA family ATPase [Streptomyces sp. B1866]|uniref:AAA family ATPase n=1 Tax=Streptomyces sp. B1866 TaxID=3075431 RepID=UPI002890A735|nr:AAA family ATPase [Streptomyces sp. B1866]MDT3396935.1 AAA family ATPase [Streptomyces sp. B1866]
MLVEREQQLAILRSLFDESRDGRGRSVAVTGPVASGKTEFVYTFAQEVAATGGIVLNSSALPSEQGLSFGVLLQLLRSPQLDAAAVDRARRVTDGLGAENPCGDQAAADAGDVSARVVYRVSMAVLELMEQAGKPILLIVDDAHFSDQPSCRVLLSLLGRLRSRHPFMLLLSGSTHQANERPLFPTEPLPKPRCERLRLGPLTAVETAAVLARRIDPRGAREWAPDYQALSGGSPLLLRGLIEDSRAAVGALAEVPAPVPGPDFAQAVLDCLHRAPVAMLIAARALAVLGDSATPARVAHLTGQAPDIVAQALTGLQECGVLAESGFRTPEAADAVLGAMRPRDRAELRTQAAYLLHTEGEPARAVARQLLEADVSRQDGRDVGILQEAADQAIVEGDVEAALPYLWLARRLGSGPEQLARTEAMLARAEWWLDPTAALRRARTLEDFPPGSLSPVTQVVVPLVPLLWFGDLEKADAALDRLEEALPDLSDDLAWQVHAHRLWRRYLFPAPIPDGPPLDDLAAELPDDPAAGPARQMHPLRAAALMAEALRHGFGQESVERAERVLQEHRLNERTLSALATAITALIRCDRLATAAKWCETLVEESEATGVPMWHAVCRALYAEIALRRSDFQLAEESARRALTILDARNWGVAVGLPLGTLLEAAAAMGKYDEAVEYLRTPVPDAMFQTPFGLRYLQACGRYHHANGQYHAALEDFRTIARLTAEWGLELPVLFPWRVDAAHALLKLGQAREARELAEEQLALCGPGDTRSRAAALRVLAAQCEPEERLPILREVVAMLRDTENRLEFGAALTDLGMTLQALRQDGLAKIELRRAQRIVKECGGEDLMRTLIRGPRKAKAAPLPPDPVQEVQLSEAERRVAVRAAQGMSNRQISRSLHITISTVEQHLTRVYRKLDVSRRADLALALAPEEDRVSTCT